MLTLLLGLFGTLAYLFMEKSIRATIDDSLHQRLQSVRDIINGNAPAGLAALRDEFSELMDSEGPEARLRVAYHGGAVIFASPDMPLEIEPTPANSDSSQFRATVQNRPFRFLREQFDVGDVRYDVEVAASTMLFDRSLVRFRRLLFAGAPLFLILVALGGQWLSRRALTPVDKITEAARKIGERDLSRRLEVPRTGDEIERLAMTLNTMLSRLEAAFQRITRFTADASHELRTPLTRMRANAEITLRRPRSNDEYHQAVSRTLVETEKVSQLVEQMLTLARADSGAETLQFGSVELKDPVRSACEGICILAAEKDLKFSWSVPDNPIMVWGDSSALERLFLILIDNAVKYTVNGGAVDVSLRSDDGFAVAQVRDSGVGIATADIAHIFDRFYRADRARSRDSGGTGLGLAIGQWIAQAHGGEICVESELGKGSTFQAKIPLLRA